jgi:hypothetical protein
MLHFAKKPDADFTAILHMALEYATAWSVNAKFWDRTTFLKHAFSPRTGKKALQDLLAASRRPEVYALTRAHWLLLFDAVDLFCEDHNRNLRIDPVADAWPVGDYESSPIDFDYIRFEYFWNLDIARNGYRAMPRDLKLIPCDGPAWGGPLKIPAPPVAVARRVARRPRPVAASARRAPGAGVTIWRRTPLTRRSPGDQQNAPAYGIL